MNNRDQLQQVMDDMRMAKIRALLEAVVGLVGLGMIWYATSWVGAFGVFLALFANNMGHSKHS